MSRVYNFSAGPAALPEPVLKQAASEMLDWHGSGMSVMEMSHRGREFMSILEQAEADLRDLLKVPDNYKVLFLQGGGVGQNAFVPMNLLRGKKSADYVNTGEWSKRSIAEAAQYAKVNVAASSEAQKFSRIPKQAEWRLDPNAAYVHICANETLNGLQYHWTPETGRVPLVADMSSEILSHEIDVSRFGLIYAGAQKNIGPSGLTLAIVRDSLLGGAMPITPSAFDYTQQADAGSMLNTPPTYAIYVAGLVFRWLKAQGGVAGIEARNLEKATMLYDCLDTVDFYSNPIAREDRSLMNIPFRLKDESLNDAFLEGARERGLVQLKGHRLVGGMRASIYNAMPIDGVKALVDYMKTFATNR